MPGCTSNCNNCPVFICAYNKTPGLDHVKNDKDKQGQTRTNKDKQGQTRTNEDKQGQTRTNEDNVSYSVHKNNKFNIRR